MKKNDSTAPLSLPVFRQISAIAARQDVPAFVVGGYVRDFYLGRPSTDIDVVVVGSGIGLAEELGRELRTKVSVYKTFGTAALRTRGVEVEFVGARKESYVRDSRKPQVEAGTLEDDQRRRDFTINAMAWSLGRRISAAWSILSTGCGICTRESSARRATRMSPFRTIRCG